MKYQVFLPLAPESFDDIVAISLSDTVHVISLSLAFDGVTPEPYINNRGRDLLKYKLDAIENCRKANLGVVLVPIFVYLKRFDLIIFTCAHVFFVL